MHRLKVLVVLFSLVATACTQPHRPIPAGTYYPDSGNEKVVVVPSMIYFHVNVDRKRPGIIGSRDYPYEVSTDGTIHFVVSSNSAFGLSLAMDYEWLWRGGKIGKVDMETGKTTWFAMRD